LEGGLSAWQNDKAKPGYVPGHFGVTLHSVHGRAGVGGGLCAAFLSANVGEYVSYKINIKKNVKRMSSPIVLQIK